MLVPPGRPTALELAGTSRDCVDSATVDPHQKYTGTLLPTVGVQFLDEERQSTCFSAVKSLLGRQAPLGGYPLAGHCWAR